MPDPEMWERIDAQTDRMPVPDGWLVRCKSPNGIALQVVSDPDGQWVPSERTLDDVRRDRDGRRRQPRSAGERRAQGQR